MRTSRGQRLRPGRLLARKFELLGQVTRAIARGIFVPSCLQLLAARLVALSEASQRVGQALERVLDMEHIAMARRTGQGNLLAQTRALPRVGSRVVGAQSLRLGVQQMHPPGVAVAVRFTRQHVAIRRRSVHAGQYRLRALEDLVVQADPHGRQLDAGVDVARPAGRRFENPVNGADAYRPAQDNRA